LLPSSETSIPRDTAGTVTLSVTAEGTLAWNKDVITLDEFLERITRYKIEEADPRVLINADERALFARSFMSSIRCASPRSQRSTSKPAFSKQVGTCDHVSLRKPRAFRHTGS